MSDPNLSALTDRQLLLLIAKEQVTHGIELEGIRSALERLAAKAEHTATRVDALITDTRQERLERRRELRLARERIIALEEAATPLGARVAAAGG